MGLEIFKLSKVNTLKYFYAAECSQCSKNTMTPETNYLTLPCSEKIPQFAYNNKFPFTFEIRMDQKHTVPLCSKECYYSFFDHYEPILDTYIPAIN